MGNDIFPSIPNYEIIRPLGEGGMGSVYLGHNLEDKSKEVAIKVLRRCFGQPALQQSVVRFKREIEICKQLSHPNIVTTLAGGVNSEGELYLVLEYLAGDTLEEVVSSRPLKEIEAIEVGMKLCSAISNIHTAGLYHRDIKPANIILLHGTNPVLIDFGLALANNKTRLTDTGMAMGTLLTMSPEQLMGKELDEASDVYSLGATLFFAVTGKYPFNEEAVIALAAGVKSKSAPMAKSLKSDLTKELSNILLKSLQANSKKRFLSAKAFKEALSMVGSTKGSMPNDVVKQGESLQLRAEKTPARVRILIGICVVLVALVVVFVEHFGKSLNGTSQLQLNEIRRELLSRPGVPSNIEFRSLGEKLIACGEIDNCSDLTPEALGIHDLLLRCLRYNKGSRAGELAELFIENHGIEWYGAGKTLPTTAVSDAVANSDMEKLVFEATVQQIEKAEDERVKLALLPLLTALAELSCGPSDYDERYEEIEKQSVRLCHLLEELEQTAKSTEQWQNYLECYFTALKMDLRKPARMRSLNLLQFVTKNPDLFNDHWSVVKLGIEAMLKSTKDHLDDVDTSYHVFAIDALRKVQAKLISQKQKFDWAESMSQQLNRVGKQEEALKILDNAPFNVASHREKNSFFLSKAKIYITCSRFKEALHCCKEALRYSEHNRDDLEKLILKINSLKVLRNSGAKSR